MYEDDDDLRRSFEFLLSGIPGFNLVGAYAHCRQVEAQIKYLRPDVVLMDIEFEGEEINGIEATIRSKKQHPAVEVLILTGYEEDDKVMEAILAGAKGYLLKESPPDQVLKAITGIHNGEVPMTPTIARKVLNLFRRPVTSREELDKLTAKEQEVLQLIAKGNSMKMVAAELGITVGTVRHHTKSIYAKLEVHSATEAIAKIYMKR